MRRTIDDLSSEELLVIEYLFQMTGSLDFNEYLGQKGKEKAKCFFEEYLQNPVEDVQLFDGFARLADATLDEYYPDPGRIKNPGPDHKAYAGLKEMMRYATNKFIEKPGVLERLITEHGAVPSDRYERRKLANKAQRDLIRAMILDVASDIEDNIYVDDFIEHQEGERIPVSKQVIWKAVEDWLYGDGVVGITEQMTDMKIRGELTVLIALLDREADRVR